MSLRLFHRLEQINYWPVFQGPMRLSFRFRLIIVISSSWLRFQLFAIYPSLSTLHCMDLALGTERRCPCYFYCLTFFLFLSDVTKKSGYNYSWRIWSSAIVDRIIGATNGLNDNDAMTLTIMYSFSLLLFIGIYEVIVFSTVGKTNCIKDGELYRK